MARQPQAIECGDSLACLWYEHPGDLVQDMTRDLNASVNLDAKRSRIYVVRLVEDKMKGSFIFGRSAPPRGPVSPLPANRLRTRMSSFAKTVLTDTGFWYAFYNARDQYHEEAERKGDLLETSTVLLPWPCLYETFNTRFAKNTIAVRHFEILLRRPHVVRLPDEPYRETALQAVMTTVASRSMSLVDMVIRLILDDINVRKHGLLTFNHRDFSDLCRKHRIEML